METDADRERQDDVRRRGIVVMDFDCYTGDRSLIPTHGDSLDK